MSGQTILTVSKLCWKPYFVTLCPNAIFHPDEIFSTDDNGVTVWDSYKLENFVLEAAGATLVLKSFASQFLQIHQN